MFSIAPEHFKNITAESWFTLWEQLEENSTKDVFKFLKISFFRYENKLTIRRKIIFFIPTLAFIFKSYLLFLKYVFERKIDSYWAPNVWKNEDNT